MPNDQTILESEDVLFRIWLYRLNGLTHGVIDLMRKRDDYYDASEAIIIEDKYNILRLKPREEGKDLPLKWYPLLEANLLAPISTKAIRPYLDHVFGEGKLCKILDRKYKFTELDLQDVKIISPKEFQYRGGGLLRDNLPDTYSTVTDEVSSPPPPKVFLCHSSKDKPFVRHLAKELTDNEIKVWFDEEDILVGQSFIERMEDGIQTSDFVIVVLTPNFLSAPWARRELEVALLDEIKSNKEKVLPILREDCAISGFVALKSHIDFRGEKFEEGLKTLLRSIFKLVKEDR